MGLTGPFTVLNHSISLQQFNLTYHTDNKLLYRLEITISELLNPRHVSYNQTHTHERLIISNFADFEHLTFTISIAKQPRSTFVEKYIQMHHFFYKNKELSIMGQNYKHLVVGLIFGSIIIILILNMIIFAIPFIPTSKTTNPFPQILWNWLNKLQNKVPKYQIKPPNQKTRKNRQNLR